jgi:repressor LexA
MRELEKNLWTDLTERQEQVLDYIEDCIEKEQLPPSRAQIAIRFGFKSPNAAEEIVKALARKGRVTLTPNVSRGIRLVRAGDRIEREVQPTR